MVLNDPPTAPESGIWMDRPQLPNPMTIAMVLTLVWPFAFVVLLDVLHAKFWEGLVGADAIRAAEYGGHAALNIGFVAQVLAYLVTTAWCGVCRRWRRVAIMLVAVPVLLLLWYLIALIVSLGYH
jgi:hypothetical protein